MNRGIILDTTHLMRFGFFDERCLWNLPRPTFGQQSNNSSSIAGSYRSSREWEWSRHPLDIDRGVIGSANGCLTMLESNCRRGKSTLKRTANVRPRLADRNVDHHMEPAAQIARQRHHIGIALGFGNGAFGHKNISSMNLESIADLQKLPTILANRGYSEQR